MVANRVLNQFSLVRAARQHWETCYVPAVNILRVCARPRSLALHIVMALCVIIISGVALPP